jgi:hypothetical protein
MFDKLMKENNQQQQYILGTLIASYSNVSLDVHVNQTSFKLDTKISIPRFDGSLNVYMLDAWSHCGDVCFQNLKNTTNDYNLMVVEVYMGTKPLISSTQTFIHLHPIIYSLSKWG